MEQLQSVSDLVEMASRQPVSNVIIAGGDRVEDLRLVEAARDHGIINRMILVGHKDRIEKSLAQEHIDVDRQDIIGATSDEEIGQLTTELINAGGIDIVLKGNISTPIINRYMLTLAVRPTVSLSSIFDSDAVSDGKPIILTDPGVTTVCSIGRLIDMINNAVDVAQMVMGIEKPRVAVLSANEKQIPSLPSTWIAKELAKRDWQNATVCGPLSFDLATDQDSVAIKGMPKCQNADIVAGNADILVCPGIDSANILYKSIAASAKCGRASIAGITIGFKIPYIILSRSDTLSTRLESIALSSIYMQRKLQLQKEQTQAEETVTEIITPKRILVINPGSTSLKLAAFENEKCVHESETDFNCTCSTNRADIEQTSESLMEVILSEIEANDLGTFDAIAPRGGFLPSPSGKISGGTYLVADKQGDEVIVCEDIVNGILDHAELTHASNLAIPVAAKLAQRLNVPAYMTDPVVVDEFQPLAEISGYKSIKRSSIGHILSIKAAMKKAAKDSGRGVEDTNFVIAHLGGGMTIAAVKGGKIIDNNNALLGEGPFTPQRAGSLPTGKLIDMCYSGEFTADEIKSELTKKAGLISYLGDHRMEKIETLIDAGDEKAKLVVDAMIYQIAKEVGAMFVAADCNVDAIVFTGGLLHCKYIRNNLRRKVSRLAPVTSYPGSLEMQALAAGALEVLTGNVEPIVFKGRRQK
jgi:butyrate kinase